jgi:hypothetical protein
VGKCMSMSVAVPCAHLYTRFQYAALQRDTRSSGDAVEIYSVGRPAKESISAGSNLEAHIL